MMAEAFTTAFTVIVGAVLGIVAAGVVGWLVLSAFGALIRIVEWVCDILEERYG